MNNVLEEIFKQTLNSENEFVKKRILLIPSESYDGAIITIIEGLNKLGFEILVYKKDNINSWFCNTIIHSLENIEDNIDFILSNLHWGTRWDLYENFEHKVPYVLVDGDDHNNCSSWINKYNKYTQSYKIVDHNNNVVNKNLSNFRWMIKMPNTYKPDIIFKSQKFNKEGIYLPFGINNSYLKFHKNKKTRERKIDISHFPGPGVNRHHMTNFIKNNFKKYNVINKKIYGDLDCDCKIKPFCLEDQNIHSWHRWKTCKDYFNTINDSKICIYEPAPGGWDSKRPWEMLSQGTLLLFYKPNNFFDKEYSISNIEPYNQITSYDDLIEKSDHLLNNLNFLETKRKLVYDRAMKYFSSVPIARYFLWNIVKNN